MKRKLFLLLRKLLRRLGLFGLRNYFYTNLIYNFFYKEYQNINTCALTIEGVDITFSTQDRYSKRWFFPRCDKGAIPEEGVTRLIVKHLKTASCFVDVGAHLGYYTCLASKFMPNGKVYAFEMDVQVFSLLEKNVALNQYRNVVAKNVAVSDHDGFETYSRLSLMPDPGLQLNPHDKKGGIQVKSITLDSFFVQEKITPDIFKIDVEGAELKVLQGMSRLLSNPSTVLFVEVHPRKLRSLGATPNDVLDILLGNGYNIYEVEQFRSQEGIGSLKKLGKDCAIKENAMIYARN